MPSSQIHFLMQNHSRHFPVHAFFDRSTPGHGFCSLFSTPASLWPHETHRRTINPRTSVYLSPKHPHCAMNLNPGLSKLISLPLQQQGYPTKSKLKAETPRISAKGMILISIASRKNERGGKTTKRPRIYRRESY